MRYIFTLLVFIILPFTSLHSQTYTLNNALNGTTVTTCRGVFQRNSLTYDCISLAGSNYNNNENKTVTFCSGTPGVPIRVSFLYWSLETNFDFYMYTTDLPQHRL